MLIVLVRVGNILKCWKKFVNVEEVFNTNDKKKIKNSKLWQINYEIRKMHLFCLFVFI